MALSTTSEHSTFEYVDLSNSTPLANRFQVAMTINTPVISRFAARSVVTLANGQHIQVLPDITWLSRCQKYQAAAFISDRGQLVVWDDEPTAIVQRVQNLERELLNMIWRNDVDVVIEEEKKEAFTVNLSEVASTEDVTSIEGTTPEAIVTTEPGAAEAAAPKRPKVKLLQPFGIGLALTLVVAAMGNGFSKLLVEAAWDHQYARFGLIIVLPFLAWFSLVSCSSSIQDDGDKLMHLTVLFPSLLFQHISATRPYQTGQRELALLCWC